MIKNNNNKDSGHYLSVGARPTAGWKWARLCAFEQVLGLGKEGWLLEVPVSKNLQRDQDPSLEKKDGGSQCPWLWRPRSKGCEPCSRTSSPVGGIALCKPPSLTPTAPLPPSGGAAGMSPGQAALEALGTGKDRTRADQC